VSSMAAKTRSVSISPRPSRTDGDRRS
jgi:hypothetical protein